MREMTDYKTINLQEETWKRRSKLKIDTGAESMEKLEKAMLDVLDENDKCRKALDKKLSDD